MFVTCQPRNCLKIYKKLAFCHTCCVSPLPLLKVKRLGIESRPPGQITFLNLGLIVVLLGCCHMVSFWLRTDKDQELLVGNCARVELTSSYSYQSRLEDRKGVI